MKAEMGKAESRKMLESVLRVTPGSHSRPAGEWTEDHPTWRHYFAVVGICAAILLALVWAFGCQSVPQIQYIPESQRAVRVKAGEVVTAKFDSWLVPDGPLAILMEKAERYDAKQLPANDANKSQ